MIYDKGTVNHVMFMLNNLPHFFINEILRAKKAAEDEENDDESNDESDDDQENDDNDD